MIYLSMPGQMMVWIAIIGFMYELWMNDDNNCTYNNEKYKHNNLIKI